MNNREKQQIGIIVNVLRTDTNSILKKINSIIKKYNIESIIIDYDISSYNNIKKAAKELKNVSMLISIGGDGTLLSALKIAIKYDISVLPIYNGTLGFISEIPPEEAYLILGEYFENKKTLYEIEPRTLLSVNIYSKEKDICKEHLAVNELVLSKCDGRAIYVNIIISGKLISSIVGDGVVIATPTGSTAYALSAGGPILAPTIDAISFVPIAPHSLTFRPLVIPKCDNIELELTEKSLKAMVTIDGYDICQFKNDDKIKAKISNKSCYIFQSANRLFYDILRNKLNWGR
ncbi:NAD(+) kinase [Brachyspira hyodysenteriae]|uniref:NAD(+)/NADH kinase n=1 Tax=Brachyspira hyodysenteriae TaxID=159 RepID=UPI0011834CD1|nr:NAD(+)/NADH kinase [Brachyspira hyodysenteriae]TVL79527.1 NAD(+) kinase [Brachyspira hyodysenteriae]TVL82495.1 NAD(+) kinase [Brachyspira hyodysenteriae]WPC24804.1 NAD(+)/NADH kinase [Brachyspira hyodysenteriae]